MRKNLFWLSDKQWERIEPHLPTDIRGVERVDDRRVISGIVHVLKSGCRWCDCPPESVPTPKTKSFTGRAHRFFTRSACLNQLPRRQRSSRTARSDREDGPSAASSEDHRQLSVVRWRGPRIQEGAEYTASAGRRTVFLRRPGVSHEIVVLTNSRERGSARQPTLRSLAPAGADLLVRKNFAAEGLHQTFRP